MSPRRGRAGLFRDIPGCAGPFRAVPGCTGPYWDILGCTGLYCAEPCLTLPPRSESLRTPDGGQLILDWADGSALPAACPTVLLLPGLTSSSQASYVLHMVHRAARAGYR